MPLRTISRAWVMEEVQEVEEVDEVEEVEEKTDTGGSACSTRAWISWMTSSGGRLRDLPRTKGITQ